MSSSRTPSKKRKRSSAERTSRPTTQYRSPANRQMEASLRNFLIGDIINIVSRYSHISPQNAFEKLVSEFVEIPEGKNPRRPSRSFWMATVHTSVYLPPAVTYSMGREEKYPGLQLLPTWKVVLRLVGDADDPSVEMIIVDRLHRRQHDRCFSVAKMISTIEALLPFLSAFERFSGVFRPSQIY